MTYGKRKKNHAVVISFFSRGFHNRAGQRAPTPAPTPTLPTMEKRGGHWQKFLQKLMCFLREIKEAPATGMYEAVHIVHGQGLWLGHDIEVETPPGALGFFRYGAQSPLRLPRAAYHNAASHPDPPTDSESLGLGLGTPFGCRHPLVTGLPLSPGSSSKRGRGCQMGPRGYTNLAPSPACARASAQRYVS